MPGWPPPQRPGISAQPVQGREPSEDAIAYRDGRSGVQRWESQKRAQRSAGLQIYFANVTSWSQKAEEYLHTPSSTMQLSHVVAVAEHPKKVASLIQMVKRLRKCGWRTTAVDAALTGTAQVREGQGHGGVMVATRDHLHQRGLTAEGKASVQREEHQGLVTQWTAWVARARGRDIYILFVVTYLAPGLGLEDTNIITLQEAGAYIKAMGLDFVLTRT